WAEVVLLPHYLAVGLPAVARDGNVELLPPGHFVLLDLQGDVAERLRGVEGEDDGLLPRLAGDPAATARPPPAVEGTVDGVPRRFRSHDDRGGRRDIDLLRPGGRWGVDSLDLLAQHKNSFRPARAGAALRHLWRPGLAPATPQYGPPLRTRRA